MKKISLSILCSFAIVHAMQEKNTTLSLPSKVKEQIVYSLVDTEKKSPHKLVVTIQKLRRINKVWNNSVRKTINRPQFTKYFIETLYAKKFSGWDNKLVLATLLGTVESVIWIKNHLPQKTSDLFSELQIARDSSKKLPYHEYSFLPSWLRKNIDKVDKIADINFGYQDYLSNERINGSYVPQKVIKLFVDAGADITKIKSVPPDRKIALIHAIFAEREDLMELLGNPAIITKEQFTEALFHAVRQFSLPNVKYLLAHGAQVNAIHPEFKDTALCNAISIPGYCLPHEINDLFDNIEIILYSDFFSDDEITNFCTINRMIIAELIKAGADISIKNHEQLTPLAMAIKYNRKDLIPLLSQPAIQE